MRLTRYETAPSWLPSVVGMRLTVMSSTVTPTL